MKLIKSFFVNICMVSSTIFLSKYSILFSSNHFLAFLQVEHLGYSIKIFFISFHLYFSIIITLYMNYLNTFIVKMYLAYLLLATPVSILLNKHSQNFSKCFLFHSCVDSVRNYDLRVMRASRQVYEL